MSVPSLPRSVGQLRRFAVALCEEHGFDGSSDTLALLVSEVATNALLHGSGDVRLRVIANAARVRIEIGDDSDDLPLQRHDGLEAEGGRGIELLESLSDSWGVESVAPQGKVVWFELAS